MDVIHVFIALLAVMAIGFIACLLLTHPSLKVSPSEKAAVKAFSRTPVTSVLVDERRAARTPARTYATPAWVTDPNPTHKIAPVARDPHAGRWL